MFSFRIPNMAYGGCTKVVIRTLHGVDPQVHMKTDPLRCEAGAKSILDKHALPEVLSEAGYPEGR